MKKKDSDSIAVMIGKNGQFFFISHAAYPGIATANVFYRNAIHNQ
jgi:hypothetical protein